jgi:hypothetical protein
LSSFEKYYYAKDIKVLYEKRRLKKGTFLMAGESIISPLQYLAAIKFIHQNAANYD